MNLLTKISTLKLIKLKLPLLFFFACLSDYCFSSQKINWQACVDNPEFQCGMLTVPEDYKNPGSKSIKLPITLYRAKGNKLGTIIFNAGGPWYDDVSSLHGLFKELSDTIKEHFDLTSFTPRGVSPNTIACHTTQIDVVHEIDRELNLTYLNSEEGAQSIYELVLKKRSLCQYDALVSYASTRNTVQDLDELRKALDVDKINYLGGSYGTRLGLAYLVFYPQHVNNIVLDGNIAPGNDFSNFIHGVAPAIENTLHAFFDLCAKSGNHCALYRSEPQKIQLDFQKLVAEAETTGLPTTSKYSNRPLSAEMLMHLVISALGSQGTWPLLANALNQAITTDNADLLMSLYMYSSGYNPISNTFTHYNDSAVFDAVYCTDYSISQELKEKQNWLATMRNLRSKYPLAGGAWATYFAKQCIAWPIKSEPLLPDSVTPILNAEPKVLLVGNAFDPITSLKWSNKVSDYLTSLQVKNKVIIWEGAGHLAYHANSPVNGCIDNNVDQFFITGKLPATDSCNDKTNPFELDKSVLTKRSLPPFHFLNKLGLVPYK